MRRLLAGLLMVLGVVMGAYTTHDCASCPVMNLGPEAQWQGQPSPYRGMADPSIRKQGIGQLLAFSWVGIHPNGTPGVGIKLATSNQAGVNWTVSDLWPSVPQTDPDGRAGYAHFETASLAPRTVGPLTVWYAARMDHFVPTQGGYSGWQTNSWRLAITGAWTPQGLASSPIGRLAGSGVDPAWGVDTYLDTLDPAVSDCELWLEPALVYTDRLYMVTQCSHSPWNLGQNRLVVLSTQAIGPSPAAWSWTYESTLMGVPEALELGYANVTQPDVVKGVDGEWLLVVSGQNGLGTQQGCLALELASPEQLARDAQGKLVVRAKVVSSDLTAPSRPGACAYEPSGANGILLTKRIDTLPSGLRFEVVQSGVKP